MWKLFVSFALVSVISGCSLLAKPKVVDNAQQQAPLPEALIENYSKGLQLLKDSNWNDALPFWQNLSQTYATYPGVWVNLALVELHLEHWPQSQTYLDKAFELNAEFCPAIKVQALLKRQQGQFKDAEAGYLKALACDETDASTAYNLAILYDLYLQDLPQALAYYQKAQELFNNSDENLAMWIADLQKRQPKQLAGEGE
ncbi:MAG: hypothetical protein RL217_2142 [Pseudomonadota bacterium]|jgi:tetratricopeptide (TPR) repeat protein